MNKKAQYDIIAFIGVVVCLLILAPILFKIVNTSLSGFSTAINQTSPEASENVEMIKNTFITWIDYLIILAFLVNVILLFIFAFTVDTHPIFVIFYILAAAFIMMFAPYTIEPVKKIFGMSNFSEAVLHLPLTDFVVSRFSLIIFGIIIVAGIIMYAKFRGGRSSFR